MVWMTVLMCECAVCAVLVCVGLRRRIWRSCWEGRVPVSTLEESIAAMASTFKELQAKGQLSDKDLQ